jgi:exodeoxyribonuclease V alpha subunit
MTVTIADRDPLEARFAVHASGLLRVFNAAGVLSAADVHVARRLMAIAAEEDDELALAVALAVRAPRLGHVYVDLERIRDTAAIDADEPVDLGELPWPDPEPWVSRVSASGLVSAGDPGGTPARPLRLEHSWLYLDRYWGEEVRVAAALHALAEDPPTGVDEAVLASGVRRLFGEAVSGRQSLAAASAVLRRFAVVAGGPGTGKTTTVARIVALLCEQPGAGSPLIALAAPTGKAAARLEEAVHAEAVRLDVPPEVRDTLLDLHATTLHRLLGRRPGSESRFRHDRNQRLPHDVVIVDETSMVSLSLMTRLIEALRSDARLVLVGDPGQLASIEAGAVLGDIVGPAADGLLVGKAAAQRLAAVTGVPPAELSEPPSGLPPSGLPAPARPAIGDGIVVLDRVHRFGGGIAELATAIRRGDPDAVLALLRDPPEGVRWIEADVAGEQTPRELALVRDGALEAARRVIAAARAGAATEALQALGAFRILCAHRRGPYGVSSWTARMEGWLGGDAEGTGPDGRWYPGRPLLVVENDYELRLNNGDSGVVVRTEPDRLAAVFPRGDQVAQFSPSRLAAVETVYAMTIHKSQGSQFDAAAVLLPEPTSRILTRELLYTAVTRARRELIVAGTEESVRAGVQRPVARASGLRRRLWDQPDLG